ncbi:MAG: Hsp20/alpha crystallin family protein [Actinomycetes bacterium]
MATNPQKRPKGIPGGSIPKGIQGASSVLNDLVELLKNLSEQAQSVQDAADALPSDAPRTKSRTGGFTLPGGARGVYGLSIRSGIGGDEPVVNEFGNVKMTNEGVVVSEIREPLVDVFDEGEEILVVFELPGVAEADITVDLNGDVLALTAKGPRHRYESETLLPAAVDAESAQQSYENGYLQVRYTKSPAADAVGESDQEGRERPDE